MWWAPGLLAMILGFSFTVILLLSALRVQRPQHRWFVRLLATVVFVEFPLLCGAVVFIVLAEMGVL